MFDQRETFSLEKELIQRDIDLGQYIKSSLVVVISGIRRCGKSSLLYLLKQKMALSDDQYCYFNFDDERVTQDAGLPESLFNLHLEVYGREPVLFFDEIQNMPGWEKFVNRMYERGIKIFVTGSNASLLSSEIATSLTGRNKVIELYPFSFREYLRFLNVGYELNQITPAKKSLLQRDFNTYMESGGFPLVVKENDTELINGYYQDILYRDIISRYRLAQVNELKEIGLYFAANIGKIFSYATLQKVSGIKSLSTIKDYLGYYEQSYLFYYLKKFDYSVKKQIMNPKKVYAIDPGFASRLGFRFSENKGRILENIVFLELKRKKEELFYHSGKYECDFVIKQGIDITGLIQVTDRLSVDNLDRELNGLKEAMHTYQLKNGLLLVNELDDNIDAFDDSIKVLSIWQWLLS